MSASGQGKSDAERRPTRRVAEVIPTLVRDGVGEHSFHSTMRTLDWDQRGLWSPQPNGAASKIHTTPSTESSTREIKWHKALARCGFWPALLGTMIVAYFAYWRHFCRQ